ncbi:MAG: GDP-fucose synthetase [Bacteroidetes bacterium GWA2_30_7]|nr:MAG: GDP-fucose synthetase [Bacteroidetes bacterium GWA2_30_7]
MLNQKSKIYIAGHLGMVGSAIHRLLLKNGFENIIIRNSYELDLRNQLAVDYFFKQEKPEYVFLAAAKVGGILANNNYPAEFIYDNIMIQSNIIHQSYLHNVKKLLFLGSSCIYPSLASQPIKEEYLLSGYLESSNEAYTIAKISGIKMCQSYKKQYNCNFISVIPPNLYGMNDNYDLDNSHVLPALIRKTHNAKIKNESSVVIWGTGTPIREFMFADDLAFACVFLMENYNENEIINIGTGEEVSIKQLAELVFKIIDYKGMLSFDFTKPNGTPRKLLDSTKLKNLGFNHKIRLEEGIKLIYQNYIENYEKSNNNRRDRARW